MSEKILVTGGNGFLATHVIRKLLDSKKDYTVVAAVRSQSKANDVLSKLNHPRLSTVIVPDISAPDAFDEVIRSGGFTGIQHVAAPFAFSATTTPEDLINPGIQSTTSILRAAKLYGPTIKRVVLTSSFVGVVDTNKGFWPGGVYNDDSWNPITLEEIHKPGNLFQTYFGAKKFAEIAAWDFIRDEKPHFDLVALLPPFIFGKVIHRVDSLASLNTSNAILYNYLSGNLKGESIPDLPAIPYFIDVEDLAEVHVLAYEKPEAGGKRLQITNPKPFSNLDVTKVLAARYPERAGVLPTKLDTTKYDEKTGLPKEGLFEIDASQANKLLGLKYKPFDVSVGELFDSLRELEVKEGKL